VPRLNVAEATADIGRKEYEVASPQEGLASMLTHKEAEHV